MSIPELEQVTETNLMASDGSARENVYCIEYLSQPFYKSSPDLIIEQIRSCERLLMKTKGAYERNIIEKEILILKLILDLLEY